MQLALAQGGTSVMRSVDANLAHYPPTGTMPRRYLGSDDLGGGDDDFDY